MPGKKKDATGEMDPKGTEPEPEVLNKAPVSALEPTEVRKQIVLLKDRMNSDFWDLSRLLWETWDRALWKEWSFQSFADYVEKDLDFRERKAQYLIRIWIFFGQEVLAKHPELEPLIKKVGWTRLKELEGRIQPGEAEEYLRLAEKMSSSALIDHMKKREQEKSKKRAGDEGREVLLSKMFKLYEGQYKNVDEALALAGAMSGSDKPGNLLDLICTTFCTHNAHALGQHGLPVLEDIENQFGVFIIAAKRKTMEIVHGRSAFELMKTNIEEAAIKTHEEAKKG